MILNHIENHFVDIGSLDRLADQNTVIHRLDPRAKVLATLLFSIVVVSFPKYAVSPLLPFFLFPLTIAALGEIPPAYILRRTIPALPFAAMVGFLNPFLDTQPALFIGPLTVSAGWLSFLSILLRALLTISAAMTLIATTGIFKVCNALESLAVPRIFCLQIMFLYRYLFVLAAEAVQMTRARQLRAFGNNGMGIRPFASMITTLLVRALDRAQRIHRAMVSRGFNGQFHPMHPPCWQRQDTLFLLACCTSFLITRLWNIPQLVGSFLTH